MTATEQATRESTFRYKALDDRGEIRAGEVICESEPAAVGRLRQAGLRPISITESRPSLLAREFSMPGLGPKVKGAELAVLARQFSTMVSAGVSLLRTLDVLREQTSNPFLASTLDKVRLDVEAGGSLSEAISRHPKVFDRLFVSMIRAGEAAGALDTVLLQLADTLERSVAMRQKIRSALAYPIAVSIMVTGVILVMLIFVVPTFSGIYDDLGGTLPLPTRILVGVSDVISNKLPALVILTVVSVVAFRRWKRTERGRYRWDYLKLRAPLMGPLLVKSGVARFGRSMAVLTKSGVPVLETLRITSETVGNSVLSRALMQTRDAVRRGEPLAENLAKESIFPAMVIQLVSVGEETGALEQMFDTVGRSFEEEVETAVAGFAALIEPVLMAFIGLAVGGMVVALYLPMFRVIDLVQ